MTNTEQTVHSRMKWLLLALSVMVAIGVFALVWIPYQRQMRLIEELDAVGGGVMVKPVGPDWLRQLVGYYRASGFAEIYSVRLKESPIDDASLKELVKELVRLSNLIELHLDGTLISDDGLKHVARLTGLWDLSLDGTQITDGGLKYLAGLSSLKRLGLDGTLISDDGLKHVARLTRLWHLSLDDTEISDDGLKYLSGLTSLVELYLNDTQVSDDGLKHLAGLSSLKSLFLTNTQCTDAGVQKLQQALPDCEIYR